MLDWSVFQTKLINWWHYIDFQVYRRALIEGCEYDSIIAFYNRVFMHNMKNFILQFAPTRQVKKTLIQSDLFVQRISKH